MTEHKDGSVPIIVLNGERFAPDTLEFILRTVRHVLADKVRDTTTFSDLKVEAEIPTGASRPDKLLVYSSYCDKYLFDTDEIDFDGPGNTPRLK